ncbi:HU family DNA-binding protein, partial [Candidatus Albibeggiatoa sp. nov. BB20]
MNKAQLIDAVANSAEISKKDASQAVDAVVTQIKESLAEGDTVT